VDVDQEGIDPELMPPIHRRAIRPRGGQRHLVRRLDHHDIE
jgi:hypothetical protein